jgi:ribonuclease HI
MLGLAVKSQALPNIFGQHVDASFLKDTKNGSWGAIARMDDGSVVYSAWGAVNRCQSAEMAEAIACLEGLKLAIDLTHGNLLFETDCSSLLKIFDPASEDRSPVSLIAKEFHALKPEDRTIKIVHVNTKVNGRLPIILLNWGVVNCVVLLCSIRSRLVCLSWLCKIVRKVYLIK